MRILDFIYKKPEQDHPVYPLWHKDLPKWKPCRIEWSPEIWCGTAASACGHSLRCKPDFPWQWNIREIWVESRRAFHILCCITRPKDAEPLVRIIQQPVVPIPSDKVNEIFCCVHTQDDMRLAFDLAKRFDMVVCVGDPVLQYLREALIAVFPFRSCSTARHMAAALGAGCKVVSSDAGAAEEYLCHNAPPGRWHVIHNESPGHYAEAIKHLLGESHKLKQTDYVDDLIYAPAYSHNSNSK